MKKLLMMSIPLIAVLFSGCYSCESFHDFWGSGPVEPGSEEIFFMDSECRSVKPEPAKAKPQPVETKPAPKPVQTSCGTNAVSVDYPCPGCEIIRVSKMMPEEVQLNKDFDYKVAVTNMTDRPVMDVVLTEHMPSNFKMVSGSHNPKTEGNKIIWDLGWLDAGESKEVMVKGMATNTNCVKTCATIDYVMPACAAVQVVQPELKLSKTATSRALLCDPVMYEYVVTNTGTGDAKNITITENLPAGLTSNGSNRISIDAGTLKPGQSKSYEVELDSAKTGSFTSRAMAQSSTGLKAESNNTSTIVNQPVLVITKTGPEKQFIGRNVTYQITLTNKGDAPATDVVLEDMLPDNAMDVSATNGGKVSKGKVTWMFDSIAPNSSRKVSVTMKPGEAGTLVNRVMAKAECAEDVNASARTVVTGIPAVLLEVIDMEDPVEIGNVEIYVITATNQGSMADTNIQIVCTLEEEQQYLRSSGATSGRVQGNQVIFAPLRSLAPKQKATWRVTVKALKPGDVRFKVTMNTDELNRPVEETEATNLYQ